ncbi:Trehalose-6-phosphate phosphatase [Caenispirillum salinarum AK4]|uniref:Trehalose 6-phosphate phosphatase n=1 Tax=Caenispirillum salinarum AK4 TaxID=1238182 RepID=K9HQ41_9PROT|nr:trehalose-phosphatase [Caenispirillum salinarum]EKV30556.1 Trehalose-6-phosphate phosphatase [Caenispirillum salinarum AK4]
MSDETAFTHKPVSEVPHALSDFDAVRRALGGRKPALFLDYDGTLTGIVPRPEDAVLTDDARAIVKRVADALPTAVVSGRDRPDVEALVGIDGLIYAGSHGFDVELPEGGHLEPPVAGDWTETLDACEARLHEGLDPIKGALVERKKFSIAAHYRLVSDADYPKFREVLDRVEESFPDLKEKTGKKVFELQPNIDWHKGKCVLWLMRALKLDRPDVAPIFLGDDVTDEDAFRALQTVGGGFGVVVSEPEDDATDRRTAAAFRVSDPKEVLMLLQRLAGE